MKINCVVNSGRGIWVTNPLVNLAISTIELICHRRRFLELEELQGVNGLKALRVSVNYLSCDFYDENFAQKKRLPIGKSEKKEPKKSKQTA